MQKQFQHKPHFEYLKNQWTDQHHQLQKTLLEKHKEAYDWLHHKSKHALVGSLGSLMLFAQPVASSVATQQAVVNQKQEAPAKQEATKEKLVDDLSYILPETVQPLNENQEKVVSSTLSRYFDMPVVPTLQGKRLNLTYGVIGAEQHLMRYPGDTMATHSSSAEEASTSASGMAPGRGAWGYFAESQAAMTEKDVEREKYYIAVQTFISPGFQEHTKEYYEFFKYRKMLVVNPENGHAMVVVIGDAGPAPWTGKHLGGSPEVMKYLERQDGSARGPVLYFFVDDPDDTVPLGPIEVKS